MKSTVPSRIPATVGDRFVAAWAAVTSLPDIADQQHLVRAMCKDNPAFVIADTVREWSTVNRAFLANLSR